MSACIDRVPDMGYCNGFPRACQLLFCFLYPNCFCVKIYIDRRSISAYNSSVQKTRCKERSLSHVYPVFSGGLYQLRQRLYFFQAMPHVTMYIFMQFFRKGGRSWQFPRIPQRLYRHHHPAASSPRRQLRLPHQQNGGRNQRGRPGNEGSHALYRFSQAGAGRADSLLLGRRAKRRKAGGTTPSPPRG